MTNKKLIPKFGNGNPISSSQQLEWYNSSRPKSMHMTQSQWDTEWNAKPNDWFKKNKATTDNIVANNSTASGAFNATPKVNRPSTPAVNSLSTGFGGYGNAPKTFGGYGESWTSNDLATGDDVGGGGSGKGKTNVSSDQVNSVLGSAAGLAKSLIPNDTETDQYGIIKPPKSTLLNSALEGYESGSSGGLWTGLAGAAIGALTSVGADEKANTSYNNKFMVAQAGQKREGLKLGENGMKMSTDRLFSSFDKKKKVTPRFQAGGSLTTNIIPKGKLHKEKNDIGDKGIPVVANDGEKKFEVEKEEFILNLMATQEIEKLVGAYNESKDDSLLIAMGKLMHEELLNNTKDNTEKFVA